MSIVRHKLNHNSWVDEFLLPADFTYNFDALWRLHPEHRGTVMMFGKRVTVSRYVQSYIQAYRFSWTTHPAVDLLPPFVPFLDFANSLGYGTFNMALVNWYENGEDYIGPHSDAESQMRRYSPILSISLGAQRTFRVTPKCGGRSVLDIAMRDRTVLVMGGHMQTHYKHQVPKQKACCGARINITFRQFV